MSTVTARLDKTGEWVICGVLGCGATIAPVMDGSPQTRPRCVIFPPGWSVAYAPGPEGSQQIVWQWSAQARKRIRKGRPPRERREMGGWKRSMEPTGWTPFLPCAVRCPARRCAMRQEIDGAALGLMNLTWEEWRRLRTSCSEPGCPELAGPSGFCATHRQGGRVAEDVALHTPLPGSAYIFHSEADRRRMAEYLCRLGLDSAIL